MALQPMNWASIKQNIESGELQNLKRSPIETEKYHEHKRILAEKNIEIGDYILNKLGWTLTELASVNDISEEEKLSLSFSRKDLYKLSVNDFPYNFEPQVSHLLIWSKINLPLYNKNESSTDMNPEMKTKIETFIHNNLSKYLDLDMKDDYCWFINYRNLQSIKGIAHVHLLIRCVDENGPQGNRCQRIKNEILNEGFEPIS